MLALVQRLPANPNAKVDYTLCLTAEQRTRSRYYFESIEGQGLYLRLPRGTVLRDGDLLQSEAGDLRVRVVAKPEPIMTVTASTPVALLRAAYHLGNRHVALEVTESYLRLAPDPVLRSMLEQMGLTVQESVSPFQPETGAYEQHHQSNYKHDSTHTA